jgi:hypothetical protein
MKVARVYRALNNGVKDTIVSLSTSETMLRKFSELSDEKICEAQNIAILNTDGKSPK